ncbi:DNA-directed RNA polymerase II subunit RPB4-like [Oscarella lobularis]|uniref:DNA-directed RNA polymerase II subunit RPB4-like n=1 Tax=Oscarella lobularis TaxID=121494 RepID=UPI003313E5FD
MAASFNPPGGVQEEEDASELRFGKEFENAAALINSEVHILLEHRRAQKESEDDEEELSDVFMKTLNYTQRFSRYNNSETIGAVRRLLGRERGDDKKLHKFEQAALANLCPENGDEAKSLIPSLQGRFEEGELQELLDDLQTHKSFQS